jgi:hypothetical protein
MRIDHLRFRLIYLNIYGHNGIIPRLFWDSLMGLFLRVFGGTGMRNLPHDAFEVLFEASDNDTVRFAERLADSDADKSSVSQYFSWGRDKTKIPHLVTSNRIARIPLMRYNSVGD